MNKKRQKSEHQLFKLPEDYVTRLKTPEQPVNGLYDRELSEKLLSVGAVCVMFFLSIAIYHVLT